MSEQKFEPFQRVLFRSLEPHKGREWNCAFYSYYDPILMRHYICNGWLHTACYEFIPYEGNEHLLGTTNDPAPKWEPKPGELVAVSDDNKEWFAQVFISKVRGREEGAYESSDTHDSSQPAYWQYCEPLREHFNVPEE